MKLFHKIFLVYLLVSFILIVSVFGAMKFTAGRYFKEMEEKTEREMFTVLSHILAEDFREKGSWQRFQKDPRAFNRLVRQALHGLDPILEQPPPQGSPGPPPLPSRPPKPPFRPHIRVTLFDLGRTRVAGPPPPADMGGLNYKPILVDETVVGFIGFRKMDRPPGRLGPPLKEKLETLYIIGAILFILAGIVAYVLSRQILSPVEQLARGTRALTRFKFNTRIKVKTKDELGLLASDFNRMALTLERYESLRKQWMTDISHELRTPLSVLKGEIEALQDGIREPDPVNMNSLHSEVVYLETIVNDLHRLSMAEAGTLGMQRKPIMPVGILASVMQTFDNRLQSARLTPEITLRHKDIVIEGDGIKLKQLFSNIIENNIHYTRRPGTVRVQDRLDGDTLNLVIEDTGPGVPHESLDKIFDRLYRVDPSRSGNRVSGRGSGLGLAICMAVARGHGGDICADINEKGGLRLTIRLPVS
ncbi:MAG: HAMP domain-containing protein [Desulfobacter sp.]|nr:MAG: HAMP domain-containing protein [Desulfobacter sp.]